MNINNFDSFLLPSYSSPPPEEKQWRKNYGGGGDPLDASDLLNERPPSRSHKEYLGGARSSYSQPAYRDRSFNDSNDYSNSYLSRSTAEGAAADDDSDTMSAAEREKYKRELEFKKKQLAAAKKKREHEKKVATDRANSGFGDISKWLKSSGSESMTPLGTPIHFASLHGKKKSLTASDATEIVSPRSQSLTVSTTAIEPTISRPAFEVLEEGDMWITKDHPILQKCDKLREAFKLLTRQRRFGCANQKECNYSLHKHEQDPTVLGKLWFGAKNSGSQKQKTDKEFSCLVPTDPFNKSSFPLAVYLQQQQTEEEKNSNNAEPEIHHYIDSYKLMIGVKNYPGSIFRLRQSYQTELANLYATTERDIDDIIVKFDNRIQAAEAMEYDAVVAEYKQDRALQIDRRKRAFYSTQLLLDGQFQNAVTETLFSTRGVRFALPQTVTARLCFEVIKMAGGFDRTDRFYLQLLSDIIRGDTTNIEAERHRLASNATDVSLNRFSQSLQSNSTYKIGQGSSKRDRQKLDENETGVNYARRHANKPTDDDADEEGGGGGGKRRKTEGPKDTLSILAEASTRSAQLDNLDDAERAALLDKLAFLKDDSNGGGGNPTPPPELEGVEPAESAASTKTEFKFICPSQVAISDAVYACTPISFCNALRLVNVHRQRLPLDLPTITEYIWSGIEWAKVLENGARIWRQWRATRQPDESTFMLPMEILPSSEYFRDKVSALRLEIEEFGGPLHGESLISTDATAADLSTPTLDTVIGTVHSKRDSGIFAAVLTCGASSICIAYQESFFYLIDSHGVDQRDSTTLVRFPSAKHLVDAIRRTYPPQPKKIDDFVGQPYSLLAMYPPAETKPNEAQ